MIPEKEYCVYKPVVNQLGFNATLTAQLRMAIGEKW